MDVFAQIPSITEKSTQPLYQRLQAIQSVEGQTGRYYRLICQNDGEPEVQATCDEAYKEHLRPYLDLLLRSKEGLETEQPVVPLFQGRDGKLRFSYWAAERDYPELKDRRELHATGNGHGSKDTATRLQVSCSAELANRFKKEALQRGMSHTDLLLELVRSTVTGMG